MITDITKTLWILEDVIRTSKETLSVRDYDILNLRFGLDGKPSKTLKAIGKKYKICKERVRQIVRQSIIKAKIAVRDKRTKRLFQEAMYANPR